MRLAIAGKGGVGKTTIAATLARLAARSGVPVVAVDGDSNPNLAAALGVVRPADRQSLAPSIVARRLTGPTLAVPLTDALDQYATAAPDGVQLVEMGAARHAEEGCLCSAHAAVSALLDALGTRHSTLTVVDLEASPEHLSRGTTRHADVLLLVSEPYYRSLEATRRLGALAAELPIASVSVVANKIRSADESAAIREFCDRHGLAHLGDVPWSEGARDADARGAALVDAAPDDTAVTAVGRLWEHIRGLGIEERGSSCA